MENFAKSLGQQEISPGGRTELVAGSASPFDQDLGSLSASFEPSSGPYTDGGFGFLIELLRLSPGLALPVKGKWTRIANTRAETGCNRKEETDVR
jgi:hypothetical protein